MIPSIIISLITCICLILSVLFIPKIKNISTYVIVCLIGAIFIVIFKGISIKEIGMSLLNDSSINPIKILVLFFSMTTLSIFLDEAGLFKYLAYKAASKSKSNQLLLFIILYSLVSVLTVFTSNDIVILTFTPFICYFAKNAKINPIPYLVAEFAGANTWSMMLIIGNPTNIYLATSYNITFIEYLKAMAVPTIFAGIIEILIIYLLFRKTLKHKLSLEFEEVKVNDKVNILIGSIHLGACLLFLVLSSYINIQMWLVSVISLASLITCVLISNLIRRRKPIHLINAAKRLPYDLIPFVLSMFVIVLSLNKQGVTDLIKEALKDNLQTFKYGYTSYIACNLINNIPMSVLYASIPDMSLKALYATIIGSNIGAFLTPIGALAGIMFTSLLNKYEVNYGFKKFIKYGLIISIPTITVALLALELIL